MGGRRNEDTCRLPCHVVWVGKDAQRPSLHCIALLSHRHTEACLPPQVHQVVQKDEDLHRPACNSITWHREGRSSRGPPATWPACDRRHCNLKVVDRRERKKHNSLSFVRGDGKRRGRASCEYPALSPEATVKAQNVPLLRAMSGSLTMQ